MIFEIVYFILQLHQRLATHCLNSSQSRNEFSDYLLRKDIKLIFKHKSIFVLFNIDTIIC